MNRMHQSKNLTTFRCYIGQSLSVKNWQSLSLNLSKTNENVRSRESMGDVIDEVRRDCSKEQRPADVLIQASRAVHEIFWFISGGEANDF